MVRPVILNPKCFEFVRSTKFVQNNVMIVSYVDCILCSNQIWTFFHLMNDLLIYNIICAIRQCMKHILLLTWLNSIYIKKLLKQCDHVAISILGVYVYSIRVYIIQPSCRNPAKAKDWTTTNQRGKKINIR